MGKWVHVILDYDTENQLVNCKNCGWVKGYKKSKGRLICKATRCDTSIRVGAHKKDSNGYVARWDGSRWQGEHRHVMEQKLGRKLFRHETVHHINGVRDDNRPENLELWSSSHPAGQRVEDKLEWARDIIALYG